MNKKEQKIVADDYIDDDMSKEELELIHKYVEAVNDEKFNSRLMINVKNEFNIDILHKITRWKKEEKNKLISYIEKNNLKISPGKYVFREKMSFEEVLKILKFDNNN